MHIIKGRKVIFQMKKIIKTTYLIADDTLSGKIKKNLKKLLTKLF